MNNLTLGSLFSGSGGFELAAKKVGFIPIWKSEVEPFPILVTHKNLPDVIHLGDIKKIDGGKIPAVDIITGGPPCQDLSIAGKREGLSGSRSSLFYEMIRVVKEMRDKTNGKYPRYLVWENVQGAFSSNKGEDFYEIIKEISKIKGKINIPRPRKWTNAGLILDRDFSLGWRVLDAQYFGVPQRRNRIYLVCDFDGRSAEKILFDEESLPRNTYKSKNERKKATRDFRKSTYKSSYLMHDQGGDRIDVCINKSNTLTSSMKNHVPIVFENHGQDLRFKGPLDVSKTITASFGTGGNNQPFVVEENKFYDIRLTSENTKNHRANVYETKISRTLNTGDNSPSANQGGLAIVYATSKNSHHTIAIKDKASTLVATDYKDPPIINENLRVRRLMPKECGRLQGFPDYWCDNLVVENPTDEDISFFKGVFDTDSKIHGKKEKSEKQIKRFLLNPHSDSAEYKMWGNGVALPCVIFILEGIKKAVDVKI